MTYTYAVLEITPAAFDEIADKLKRAGYGHAIQADGQIADMHGIALGREAEEEPRSFEVRHQAKPAPCPTCHLRHPDNIPCQVGPKA